MINKIYMLLGSVLFFFTLSRLNVQADDATTYTVSDNWIYTEASPAGLSYMAYIPKQVDYNTKILLFLHGNGEVKTDWTEFIEKYKFTKSLNAKGYIVIIPFEKKKCNWSKDYKKIDKIIDEICAYSGVVRDTEIYIAGVSSGADAVTDIARRINFDGAIYMAGSLAGWDEKISAKKFASLWEGKTVYYYRDNLFHNGGYNYDEKFVSKLADYSAEGTFNFYVEDLDWDHSHELVDAAFLPSYCLDAKGQRCHGALINLFGDELRAEIDNWKAIFIKSSFLEIKNVFEKCMKSFNSFL